jgi:opacity protein-like surface antigen
MVRKVGLVFVAALMAAMPTAAQDVKPIQLSIGGGWTGVYGPAKDHIGGAGNFTLGVVFNVNPIISLQGEYAWNGAKKKLINGETVPTNPCVGCAGTPTPFYADGNMQYGDFNVLVHAPTHGKAQPYGIIGAGVYYRPVNITTPGVGYTTVCDPWWYVCYPALVSVDQVVASRSSTDFGMNFGGGVNFKVSQHASFYVEVRYHYVWGPTISSGNVPTNPIAGSDVSTTTLKANGKFLPVTFGFRF